MPKVSILVAVYNAEKYLCQSINSLLQQTLQDIQIICIDDASTDNSLKILNQYAQKDKRIQIIALPKNVGQAKARNKGLQIAQGEYTCFLDSDDYLSHDALQQAVNVFQQHPHTDCVLFQVQLVENTTHTPYPMQPFQVLTGKKACEKSLQWKIHGIYITRTKLYQQFPYDQSTHAYSDDNTTHIHFLESREVRMCNGTYYYRQHAESVTHQISIQRFQHLQANQNMKQELIKRKTDKKLLTIYENVRWLNIIDAYMFYYKYRQTFTKKDSRIALQTIQQAWKNIDVKSLKYRYRFKFGYMPLHFSWKLFQLQEEIYFTMRKIIKGT